MHSSQKKLFKIPNEFFNNLAHSAHGWSKEKETNKMNYHVIVKTFTNDNVPVFLKNTEELDVAEISNLEKLIEKSVFYKKLTDRLRIEEKLEA